MFPTLVGVFPTLVGAFPSLVGGFPTLVGVFPSLVGVFPSLVGGFPTLVGAFPSPIQYSSTNVLNSVKYISSSVDTLSPLFFDMLASIRSCRASRYGFLFSVSQHAD